MADFVPALNFMLPHEGGYCYDADDPGGETKYGLTRMCYPELDIKNLTLPEAAAIYLKDYWSPYPFSAVSSQAVASKVFDMSVNMGSKQAFLLLQRAVNDCGQKIVCDGKFGPVTLAAVNSCDPDLLVQALRNESVTFYQNLVAKRPSSSKFLNGWLRRANA